MARASDFEQEDDERTRRRSGSKRKRNKSSTHRRNRHRRRSDTEETANETESDCPPSDSSRRITDEALKDYLGKKAHKKALQVAKKLKTQTISGYTNDRNPFGDANLTEKFVWRKKIEKDLTNGLDPRALSLKSEKKRQMERMAKIEKVKKRREERAIEKAQHEEEMAMLARERARAEFQDWEKKEEEFHFEQSKVRSEIRLREGRAKPIDVLSKNLNLSDDFDIEINEPYKIYQGLSVKKMEELQIDIKMHLELDRATPTHVEFWEAMMVVCDWEISEARKRDVLDRARVRGEEPPPELVAEDMGLHVSVDADVKTTLQSRNFNELDKLQTQIEAQMRSGIAEVEFWEAILKRLHILKAKARLRQIHADLLRQHLQRLQDSDVDSDEKKHHASQGEQHVDPAGTDSEEPGQYSPKLSTEAGREAVAKEAEEELGSFSPALVQDYAGDEVVDPEADKADLERKRAEVLEEQQRRLQEAAVGPNVPGDDSQELTGPERNLALKVMSSIEEGDAILGIGSEINLESQVYWWHDKYRPRKPKYFNRIHTGYEWNKYNQTHYDHDNPTPKIVQGYKFNIFYPDLVDKTKAPTSEIEKDGSTGETCLIRFHAGPPYEDIAFRIVNKDWEYSHKKGFKSRFERGVLHLYFNFKRYKYRR